MAKNYVIVSGAWTDKGNFTGYNAKGERIHIYLRQMEAAGFKKDQALPAGQKLFVIGETKTYQEQDANGKDTGNTFDRLTALSVFKSKEELATAHAEELLLDAEIATLVAVQGKAVGISDEAMKALFIGA